MLLLGSFVDACDPTPYGFVCRDDNVMLLFMSAACGAILLNAELKSCIKARHSLKSAGGGAGATLLLVAGVCTRLLWLLAAAVDFTWLAAAVDFTWPARCGPRDLLLGRLRDSLRPRFLDWLRARLLERLRDWP